MRIADFPIERIRTRPQKTLEFKVVQWTLRR